MTFTPHGKSLIAGQWIASSSHFTSAPSHGAAHVFSNGTSEMVNEAVEAAEDAFWSYGYSSAQERATFLNAIADEIDARADQITDIGTRETGLPEGRLQGERGRTVGQLRMFATHILSDDYLDLRHDKALPDRTPLPRSDLQMIQRPIGPVAVFGASNFPLAFSTAGGDTAAALAAGCPVVVKGHQAHPGTGEIIAEAIHAAIQSCGVHQGVFSLVQGDTIEVGQTLVQHPLITAVGFTGSLRGGRALFDLCAARPNPIPFFGELGSINPMFLLPHAVAARGSEIAAGWAGSLTMGAGQFCTNPGVAIVTEGPEADALAETMKTALAETTPQTMLTSGIAKAYVSGRDTVKEAAHIETLLTSKCEARSATPSFFKTDAQTWLSTPAIQEEVFGPLAIMVTVKDTSEMQTVAKALQGQLTCTLHMDSGDLEMATKLLPILERKAGRLLANGFPTGVEVCDAMVHGGPYPASTNFGATSVGTLAIRRFLRPVCYQDMGALSPITQ
ncbi:NADP-dependent aldehyde dehydrogenase [Pacificibacter maritimus]|uniref:NADP-dependent aldehyde dehydrogenase n=1 Tax=Pacificibacter maritimus TaxID=762213 RepID=A0A3N4UX59_9RHOB|nr:aldehyde dehydrogenase (NADP(+)) [Pacificibacter maritimus]RPE72129.1 NADP-dependent aldehyde dehydrogenase [Pacificibacter maritimus]